jgi:hypothetical protein
LSKLAQQARSGAAPVLGTQPGLVVASFGRHVLVETETGQRVICHPRGKKNQAVVGDRVRWLPSQDEGTLEKIEERSNLFYRQDEMRTKSFAANLDQVLILIAAEPEFSESQLTRALIAAEAERITPIIALNKSDLTEPFGRAWAKLAPYRTMGYKMLPLAINGPFRRGTDLRAAGPDAGQKDSGTGPFGGRKKQPDQSAGAPCAGADGRDIPSTELGQAHDHQHDAVLGGRCEDHRTDRLARLPGIWPEPH